MVTVEQIPITLACQQVLYVLRELGIVTRELLLTHGGLVNLISTLPVHLLCSVIQLQ